MIFACRRRHCPNKALAPQVCGEWRLGMGGSGYKQQRHSVQRLWRWAGGGVNAQAVAVALPVVAEAGLFRPW